MDKYEILKRSRQENEGKHDELEIAAYGSAAKVGMFVGAFVCMALIFTSELIFNIPEIALVLCIALDKKFEELFYF